MPASTRPHALPLAATLAAAVIAATPAEAASSRPPSQAELLQQLMQKVDALAAENRRLEDKVQKLEAAQAEQARQSQAQAAATQSQGQEIQAQGHAVQAATAQAQQATQATQAAQAAVAAASSTAQRAGWAASTTVSSYGEIGYSRPTKDVAASTTDIARAVIGIQHRFDDRTRMAGEWEWEHAVTSSDDQGEAEVEQLWVEREFDNGVRGRAGLFLMPVGLLNQNHEPTSYYGVFRPDVDTKIIPSTWREAGFGANGDAGNGLNWDLAITTAPNLSGWDPSSAEGRDRGPLQAIHGEGQFALSRTFGGAAALNWRGVPGLWLGGSLVYDNIGQSQPGFAGNGAKLLLLDAHARYQVGRLDVAGEVVRGQIDGATALNESFLEGGVESPTYVPHLFYGGYAQAAYRLVQSGDYTLSPFVRYEIYNTAAGFGALPAGAGAVRQPDEHVLTLGASLFIGDGVVLKADYRNYRVDKTPDADHFNLGDSLNLGVGFSF